MTKRKDVATNASKSVEEAKGRVRAIRPPVNIFENDKGITVQADMPGVSKDRLDIQIDKDTLSIEGVSVVPMPEGMEALHADVRSTHYRRNFSLSSELDGEKADASLKDGVLTLSIPKREEHKPRKVEVRVG